MTQVNFQLRVLFGAALAASIFAIFVAALPAAATAQNRTVNRIEIGSESVRCIESTVRIEDIATIQSTDARFRRNVGQLDIDTFSDVKKTCVITKEQVRIRLLIAGIELDPQNVVGVDTVTATLIKQQDYREMIEQKLAFEIGQRFAIPTTELQIELNSSFELPGVVDFDISNLQIDQVFESDLPLGEKLVNASFRSENGETRTIKLPVSIAVYQDVVVAKQSITRGKTLTAENITSVRRPVSNRNIRVVSFEDAIGKQAQTDIQKYTLIKSNWIRATQKSNKLITKNSYVNVLIRRGSLTVTLKNARAVGDGTLGGSIPIINPQTSERMVARVLDATTVEIR